MIQYRCPPADRWTALLCEDLPADEQAELQYHLEQCPECQHVLDHCVAERNDWDEVPRWLASCSEADAKLKTVIDRLKNADDTSGVTDMTIDFIDPTEREGSLGRLNNYEIIGEIGRGGMGVVLKALDPALHRVVAIKVLAPQLAVSAAARKRFTREARAAAAVCHEHVVTIHSVEEFKSLPYLVMQYVAGQSLQQKLESHGPLPVADILRIGMQAAAGLAAAHAQGLVHRDIKPGNILLENGVERVRITDFGLARTIDDVAVTQSGVIAGTPQYMAPEQTRGQALDARTDLFSLGSVMYAMCTGETPFPGHHALDVIRKVGEDQPTPIREVNYAIPPWLEAIVAKLMAKDPAQRFQSAAEVAHLLERCLAHVQNPRATPLPAALTSVQQFAPSWKNSLSRRIALVLPILAGLFVVTEATGATHIMKALGTVLRFRTPEGTLVLEVDDPAIKVSLDDKDLVITGAGAQEIRLKVGAHTVRADKDGQSKTDIVTIEKDGKATLKVSLESDGFKWPRVAADAKPSQLPHIPDQPRFTFRIRNEPWNALFDHLAKITGLPVVAKVKPAGTFSFTAPAGDREQSRQYRLAEIIDIVNDALLQQGCLLVRRDKDFVVVPTNEPLDPLLYANVPSYELEQRGATELVNYIVRLENLDVADTRADVLKLLSQFGKAEVIPGGGLSISDKAENVRRILKLLTQIDQPIPPRENKTGHDVAPAAQPGIARPVLDANPPVTPTPATPGLPADKSPSVPPPGPGTPSIPTTPAGSRPQPAGTVVHLDKPVREFAAGASQSMLDAALLPDGQRLFTTNSDGTAKLWSLSTAEVGTFPLQIQGHGWCPLAVSNDGQLAAVGGSDNLIRILQTATGKVSRILRGHSEPVWTLTFTADNKRLVSAAHSRRADKGEICAWDVESGDLLQKKPTTNIRSLSISPDDHSLYLIADDGLATEVDLYGGKFGKELRSVRYPRRGFKVAADPTNKLVAIASGENGQVALWNARNDDQPGNEKGPNFIAHQKPVTSLRFSADGNKLLTGSLDGEIKYWDLLNPGRPRLLAILTPPPSAACAWVCIFSGDSKQIITAHQDGMIRIWDMPSAKPAR